MLNEFVRQASVILDGTKHDGLRVHIAVTVQSARSSIANTKQYQALFCLTRVVVYTSVLIHFADRSNATRDVKNAQHTSCECESHITLSHSVATLRQLAKRDAVNFSSIALGNT